MQVRRIVVISATFLAISLLGLCGCKATDTLENSSDIEFNGAIEEHTENSTDEGGLSANNDEVEEMTPAEPGIESVKLTTKVKYQNGSYWEYEYDEYGQRLKEMYCLETGAVDRYKVYEYDEVGRCLSELEYDGEEVLCNSHTMVYDEFGNCLEDIRYNAGIDVEEKDEYEYDENGNMIKYISTDRYGKDTYEYQYDDAGNCIKSLEYKEDGKLFGWNEYEYDGEGKLIKDLYYFGNGKLNCVIEYKYNNEGNVIEEDTYWSFVGFESPRDIRKYTYDENNNLISDEFRGDLDQSWGTFTDRWEYQYDDNNQLIQSTRYSSQYDIVDHKMEYYVYEYDENGNMIKEEYYILALGLARTELMGDGTATLWDSVEYVYDEDGDVVEKISANIDNNNDITGYTSVFYEYEYMDIIVR